MTNVQRIASLRNRIDRLRNELDAAECELENEQRIFTLENEDLTNAERDRLECLIH